MYFSSDDSDAATTRPHGAVRLMRGAWADVRADEPPWAQREQVTRARAVAAVRLCPAAVCLTHEVAALQHALPLPVQEPDISVAVSSNPQRRVQPLPSFLPRGLPPGSAAHQVALVRRRLRPGPDDVVLSCGVPVTSLERTAIDCACDLPVRQSIVILDAVFRRRCQPDRFEGRCLATQPEELREELLDRLSRQAGRRGVRRARAVISLASPWSESPGESVLRWVCAVAGAPAPVPQQRVVTGDGAVYFLDLAWTEHRVAFEFDGRVKYTDSSVLWEEKERQVALERAGWRVVRMTWKDLRDVDAAVRRVRQELPVPSAVAGPALKNLLR